MNETLYTTHGPMGVHTLRRVDPASDTPVIHSWLTHPKSVFWQMGSSTLTEVEDAYRAIANDPHQAAFLGASTSVNDGQPSFLLERYDPARRELAGLYPARPGDVGMHFLVAPTTTPHSGFTRAVLATIMDFLFADEHTQRIVVEPDARNHRVLTLNAAVGFEVDRPLSLPAKTALLSFCTRAQYQNARDKRGTTL